MLYEASQLEGLIFRMFNGRGEQQVMIPLSYLHPGGDQNFVDEPDWRQLYLWDSLTRKFLGRGQDPRDRLAPKFFHG